MLESCPFCETSCGVPAVKTMLRTQASFMFAVYFAPPQGTELVDWWSEQTGVFKLAPFGIMRSHAILEGMCS